MTPSRKKKEPEPEQTPIVSPPEKRSVMLFASDMHEATFVCEEGHRIPSPRQDNESKGDRIFVPKVCPFCMSDKVYLDTVIGRTSI